MDFVGKLYALSGAVNIGGLLVFNKCFTDTSTLAKFTPAMALESQMLIPIWGLAYLAAAKHWRKMPLMSLAFFVEKMFYVWWWYDMIKDSSTRESAIEMVTSGSDFMVGSFLLLFGINDLLFGLIFGYGALKGLTYSDSNIGSKKST